MFANMPVCQGLLQYALRPKDHHEVHMQADYVVSSLCAAMMWTMLLATKVHTCNEIYFTLQSALSWREAPLLICVESSNFPMIPWKRQSR